MKSLGNESIAQWIARQLLCGVAAAKLTLAMYQLYFKWVRGLSNEERELLTKDDAFMAEVAEATNAYGAALRSAHGE